MATKQYILKKQLTATGIDGAAILSLTMDKEGAVAIYASGAVGLTTNVTIQHSGAVAEYYEYNIYWNPHGNVITYGAFTISVFGYSLPSAYANKDLLINALYENGAWIVRLFINWANADIIEASNLPNLIITTAKIVDNAVTNDKLADMIQGCIKVGGALNAPTDLSLTANKIITHDGTNVVTATVATDLTMVYAAGNANFTIVNDAVTNAKLANITRGYIKVGGVADAPTDLDCHTASAFPLGDGTGLNAVVMGGDGALNVAGQLTIQPLAITSGKLAANSVITSKITDYNVTYSKHTSMVDPIDSVNTGVLLTKYAAALRLYCDGVTHNLFYLPAGCFIHEASIIIQVAAGIPGTINVGVDINLRPLGALGAGLITIANGAVVGKYNAPCADADPVTGWNTYTGVLLTNGMFQTTNAGYITIQSSVDLSLTALMPSLIVKYSKYV